MFFFCQALMIAYAIASAWQEAPVVKMCRDYVPHGNPYSDPFHTWGAVMTVLVSLPLALLQDGFVNAGGSLLLSGCWYWLLFDAVLNLGTGKKWHYVGQTAKVDKWLRYGFTIGFFKWKLFRFNGFGERAGLYKVLFCVVVIAAANTAFILSKKPSHENNPSVSVAFVVRSA